MDQLLAFGDKYFDGGIVLFLIRSVLMYLTGAFISKLIRKYVNRESSVRGEAVRTPIRFIGKVLTTVMWALIIFLILNDIKVLSSLGKALLGATSLIAVAVTFAAQEAFGNLISGFFLALYQPFRLDDYVRLPQMDIEGTVKEITLRHTVISTFDGSQIIIPNSTMNSQIVENRRQESELYSRRVAVSVGYETDINHARRVINDAVTALDGFIDPRSEAEKKAGVLPVTVVVTDLQDSGIELKFRIYTKTAVESYIFLGTVRETVVKALLENGIDIPYPIRTVMIRK